MQGDLRETQAEFRDWVNSDFTSLENIRFTNICPKLGGLASSESVFLHWGHWDTRQTHVTGAESTVMPASSSCCMWHDLGCTWQDIVQCARAPAYRGHWRAHPCSASSPAPASLQGGFSQFLIGVESTSYCLWPWTCVLTSLGFDSSSLNWGL